MIAALSLCLPGTPMSVGANKSDYENVTASDIRLVLIEHEDKNPDLELFLDHTTDPKAMAKLIEAYDSLYPENANRPKVDHTRYRFLRRLVLKGHPSNQEALKRLLLIILRQELSLNSLSRQYAAKTLGNMELNDKEIEILRQAAENVLVESIRNEAQKSLRKVESLRGGYDCPPLLTDQSE